MSRLRLYCKTPFTVALSRCQHSPLQSLLHQLLCVRLNSGQHTFVVGPLTDVAAKDLQNPRYRLLGGQFGGVVQSLYVTAEAATVTDTVGLAAGVPQVGAVVENI